MSPKIIYTGTKTARNGNTVPVLSNGKTFFSEYNPERDIHFYATAHSVKDSGFILIGGLGNGSHIRAVLDENPNAFIMVLEFNAETIDYLLKEGICNPKLIENPHILITTPETLCTDLKNTYIPVLCGSFLYHPVKAWQLFCDESGTGSFIKAAVQDTLHDIAADYATQARFGKLMHTNILKNLKLLSEISAVTKCECEKHETPSTAAVIGAGPSLDESMPLLKQNRSSLYIIATDTAYRSLYKSGIIADMVVTLDGQNSSIAHFIGIESCDVSNVNTNEPHHSTYKDAFKKTVVAADICANVAAARYLSDKGLRLLFFTTGHPLGTFVNNWHIENSNTGKALLPNLDAGNGTVLSAAADLAVKAGFRSILLFGADFAYKSGKPYACGTYLDETYSKNCDRLSTSETSFCSLCYRTDLSKINGEQYTTPLLASYKRSMDSFIESSNASFCYCSSSSLAETCGVISKNKTKKKATVNSASASFDTSFFDYESFLTFYLESLKKNDNATLNTILPFATWLKEKEKNADINDIFEKAAQITALHRS